MQERRGGARTVAAVVLPVPGSLEGGTGRPEIGPASGHTYDAVALWFRQRAALLAVLDTPVALNALFPRVEHAQRSRNAILEEEDAVLFRLLVEGD